VNGPADAAPIAPREPEASLLEVARPRPLLLLGAAITGLLVALLFGLWGYQAKEGLGVAGINRPVFWGVYIVNFVFWIGISHAGTLISAILRVVHAEWRRPLTRCAEAVTVFALMVGGLFPLIHMGRPWLFYWLIPHPNYRGLVPNFRSPLVWDVAAITSYLIGSSLYLLLPMIPDLALLRDRASDRGGFRYKLYRFLAAGWRGTPRQWVALERGIGTLAVAVIPVAVSVHTIVSWDFAMTMTPGWNSTIFGPYFVVGAIYSGIAVLLLAMAILRRGLHLEHALTDRTFDNLGRLCLAMTLIWGYFTFAEHLTTWYAGDAASDQVHHTLMSGRFGNLFWLMVFLNVILPFALLVTRHGRRPLGTAIAGVSIVVGMWLERLLIVVPSLSQPRLPGVAGGYWPSPVELGIMLGSIGLFVFLYFVFVQVFPIVSIWEVREGREHREDVAAWRAAELERARRGAA
jgi:molybdopterin-containing oxidoreductase family membrane subunit